MWYKNTIEHLVGTDFLCVCFSLKVKETAKQKTKRDEDVELVRHRSCSWRKRCVLLEGRTKVLKKQKEKKMEDDAACVQLWVVSLGCSRASNASMRTQKVEKFWFEPL